MSAAVVLLLVMLGTVYSSVARATERLQNPEVAAEKQQVAIADHAEVEYCTPQFKKVLQRVLHSCGLSDATGRRGCKPTDVRTFANITDDDFNALFTPLQDRGAVIMFDTGKHELDETAKKLLEEKWTDRKGARYFFIVARASKVGSSAKNRKLSHERANSVMFHIKKLAKNDPDLEKKVGMLWLGEEYAQFPEEYCDWPNSKPDEKCTEQAINQSAFISWVDCRL
jgi:outer membrane protein OmpA-like peptidoglycan-associated protein